MELKSKYLIILICSVVFYGHSFSQQAQCKDLIVTNVSYTLDELKLSATGDSSHLILVEMINTCSECSGGPDNTGLYVIYEKDTLARAAIKGIPQYKKKPRVYRVSCNGLLKDLPNTSLLRVSLDQYCPDLPQKIKILRKL